MRALVDGAALSGAVRHAGRILDRLDPARNRIMLDAHGDGLTIRADSDVAGSRVTIPATVLRPGTAAVCGTWLIALASQTGSGETLVETCGEDARLTLTAGRRTATMRLLDDDMAPAPVTVDGEDDIVLSLPDGMLARMCDATVHCASRTRTTPILSGIHLYGDGASICAETTDKYRASRIRIPHPGWEGNVTVGAEWLRGAAQGADTVRIRRAGAGGRATALSVSGPGFVDESVLLGGDWPNLARVMPERDADCFTTRISVDRAALLAAVRYLRALNTDDGDMVPIRLSYDADGLSVAHVGVDSTGRDTVSDADVDGDAGTLPAFNAPYLQDALQAVGTERVVIRCAGDRHPAMILPDGSGEDWVQVIVPVRRD